VRESSPKVSTSWIFVLRVLIITPVIIGFTIVAITWSSGVWERLMPETAKEKPGFLGPLPASAAGIIEGQEARKLQFDERMRRAEAAHKAEAAMDSASVPKKIVISSKKARKAQAAEESHDLSGGYWRWLRWGSGSPKEEKRKGASSTSSVSSPPTPPPPSMRPTEKPKPTGSWLRWVTGMSSSSSDNDKKP
jgi:hypothetical protein